MEIHDMKTDGRKGKATRWNLRMAVILIAPALLLLFAKPAVSEENFIKIPDNATARSLDGKTVSLADHKGKLVLLNVWATNCPACLYELPFLNRLQKEKAAMDLAIVGLTLDRGRDKFVADFTKKADIEYPIWLGYGEPLTDYVGSIYLPTTFGIGPNGEAMTYKTTTISSVGFFGKLLC